MPQVARTVRQLRVSAVAVALVPLSCLCVVAGIWTSSGASVVVTTRSVLQASEPNGSAIVLTLCCTRLRPSTVDCWISSDLDVAEVLDVDDRLNADDRLREIWSNVSTFFGCDDVVLFPPYIITVNVISSDCSVNTSYCVNYHNNNNNYYYHHLCRGRVAGNTV